MSTCYIVSGGTFAQPLFPFQKEVKDFVIACDKGFSHANRLGLKTDLIVGDFDSLLDPIPRGVKVEMAPVRKDDTDTLMACRIALDKGFDNVELLCAFGGRLDHTLANLQTMYFLWEQGVSARLQGAHTAAFFVDARHPCVLLPMAGYALSLFSWGERCSGVTLKGLSYPLTDAVVENTFPIGVSNKFTAEPAQISVAAGTLLAVLCKL